MRRKLVWAAIAVLVPVAVVVLTVFQPQKLFIDERVDEAAPSVAPSNAAAPTASETDAALAAVRQGMFRSLDHEGSGTAKLLQTGDAYVVRFEELNVSNGPDLYVYLSPAPSDSKEEAFVAGHLELGKLKGNQGNQNYEVPAGVDVSKYKSVVVWCKRFSSGFAVAPLV